MQGYIYLLILVVVFRLLRFIELALPAGPVPYGDYFEKPNF